MDAESRRWAVGSVLMIALLLWPLVRGSDGFPLSTYPMFSAERGERVKLAHVVGHRADGTATPMPPSMLGTGEIMQAAQIARNAARDRGRARDLCTRVAERVAADDDWRDVIAIEVRTDEYDTIAYWSDGPRSLSARVHARCDVPKERAP